MSGAKDWIAFWDAPHSIYVNARHFDVHYRDVAEGIVRLIPRDGLRLLDFGCGEAIHADKVAARVKELYLCESAGTVRDNLKRRFGALGNVSVISPEEMEALPDASLDMIVANSVAQYLKPDELDRLLREWRRLLAPGGSLILADIIPPDVGAASDVAALINYAGRNGFLFPAIVGLIKTALSDYRTTRARLGITTYTEPDIRARIEAAGYAAEKLARNIEHNPARMSFRCNPK